jgi:hypothetical protein
MKAYNTDTNALSGIWTHDSRVRASEPAITVIGETEGNHVKLWV